MSAMKKKARVDEIEKILRALLGDFQYCDIGNKQASCYPNVAIDALWLRRKLRALVRKAYFVGQYIPRYYKSRTDKFVDLFGFKP